MQQPTNSARQVVSCGAGAFNHNVTTEAGRSSATLAACLAHIPDNADVPVKL
ncbi:hypothetical protein D3C87_1793800 [compost metagenome]